MKKIYLSLIALLCFMASFSQTVASYNFSQTAGTYTPITGGTLFGTAVDDVVYGGTANLIPFTFVYRGNNYTSLRISTNGFITLGNAVTPTTTNYLPISSTATSSVFVVSALSRDLNATVRYEVVGTSPNRVATIQWSNAYRYAVGSTENLNFQIQLFETSNNINVVYGGMSTPNTTFATGGSQVGLKGAANTDFNVASFTSTTLTGYPYTQNWNNLITASGNTDIVGITTTVFPASGSTLNYVPSTCAQPTVNTTATLVTTNSASVNWTNSATYASGYNVRWRKVDELPTVTTWASPTSVAAGGSTLSIAGLSSFTYYIYSVEGLCSPISRSNHSQVTTANLTNGRGLFQTQNANPPTCIALPTSPANASTGATTGALSWPAANGTPTSYVLYFGTDGGGTVQPTNLINGTNIGNVTTYTVPSLTANTTYYWQVLGVNAFGTASSCVIWSFTTGNTPACPVTPTPANAATNINRNSTLSWTSSVGATSYDVYLGTTTGPALVTTVTTTTYTPPLLAANTQYFWRIAPKNGFGATTTCVEWSFTTNANIVYCTPTTTSGCTDGDVIARVTLNTLDNNSGTGCPSGLLGYSDYTGNTALTTTLNAGTNYSCTVFAGQYTEGYAAWIDYNDDGVFNNVTERIGFSIGQVAGSGTVGVLGSSATFPVNISCAPPTGTHRLRVRAMFNTNGSAVTPCANNTFGEVEDYLITIAPAPPCPQPSTLIATAGSPATTSEILSWTIGCAETTWDVHVTTVGGGAPTGAASNPGVTTNPFTVTGLTPNTAYEFWVRAACTVGSLYSSWSGPIAFTTTNIPPNCVTQISPTDLATNVVVNTPLTWTAASTGSAATSYKVYVGTTPNPTTLTATVTAPTLTYTPTGQTFSTTYYWKVIGSNSGGDAVICTEFSYTTEAAPPVPACTNNTAPTNGATGLSNPITISWAASATALNYDVFLSSDAGVTYANIGNTTATSVLLSVVNAGTYLFYVVPINGTGSAVGCETNATSFSTQPAPANDACINAIDLTVSNGFCETPVTGTMAFADSTSGLGGASCAGSALKFDVWYKSTVPSSGNITVQTSATNAAVTDVVLEAYSGACNALVSIGCNDDGNPDPIPSAAHSKLGLTGRTPGEVIYFRVMPYSSVTNAGPFAICAFDTSAAVFPAITLGTANTCTNATALNIDSAFKFTWATLKDASGRIIAQVYPNGNILSLTGGAVYNHSGTIRSTTTGGQIYMNRNITITPTTQPTSAVRVKLYFTDTEKTTLDVAVPGANNSSDIVVTKVPGTCTPTFLGIGVFQSQISNGLYGTSDHYIETSVTSFSQFFLHKGLVALPIAIESFKGSKQATGNLLDWKVTCTSASTVTITLERSADGRKFAVINSQTETAARCLQGFNYTDATPLAGANYYRLKITTPDGDFKYSKIVVILNKDRGFELISITPNPVKDAAILTLTSAKGGRIELSIMDVAGKVLTKKSVVVIAGNNPINMNFASLGAGTYSVVATSADGEVKTTRFVKF